MSCPVNKESTGSARYQVGNSTPIFQMGSNGSEANWNPAQTPDTYTGRYWSPSPRRRLFDNAETLLDHQQATGNYQDQTLPQSTCGRKTPESKEHNSNSGTSRLNETTHTTGTSIGDKLLMETSWKYHPTYEYGITQLSDESAKTLRNRLQWSELATYSGATLAQESLEQLGKPAVWTLTLRIQTRNSGVDIMVT